MIDVDSKDVKGFSMRFFPHLFCKEEPFLSSECLLVYLKHDRQEQIGSRGYILYRRATQMKDA